ncbi:hypothetical protein [Streptomyces tateyamensis]|nr:hypothetical protein [Streptomyces tateyamensis]
MDPGAYFSGLFNEPWLEWLGDGLKLLGAVVKFATYLGCVVCAQASAALIALSAAAYYAVADTAGGNQTMMVAALTAVGGGLAARMGELKTIGGAQSRLLEPARPRG